MGRLVWSPDEVARLRLARTLEISPKRLAGWEPRTTQRGFDKDGIQVPLAEAYTIVTEVEPEWDEIQYGLMRALAVYEAGLCGGCGVHEDVAASDDVRVSYPARHCDVCAGAAQAARIDEAEIDGPHRDALGPNPPARRVDPSDGRSMGLSITRGVPPGEK